MLSKILSKFDHVVNFHQSRNLLECFHFIHCRRLFNGALRHRFISRPHQQRTDLKNAILHREQKQTSRNSTALRVEMTFLRMQTRLCHCHRYMADLYRANLVSGTVQFLQTLLTEDSRQSDDLRGFPSALEQKCQIYCVPTSFSWFSSHQKETKVRQMTLPTCTSQAHRSCRSPKCFCSS